MVYNDKSKTKTVFLNLIENAIKFTLKGKVEILISKKSISLYLVSIKDSGVGMKKEELKSVREFLNLDIQDKFKSVNL
jgi:signal transduction histidine kinase